jgi:acyl-CoA dehydrogenase
VESTGSMHEIEEIRGLARDFASAELRPHAEAWDAGGALGQGVRGQLAELGFLGMLVPEADGGMGFDASVFAAAVEALAWGEAASAVLVAELNVAARVLASAGDGALDALLGGGGSASLVAVADDGAGIDAAGDADAWRLSGARGAVVEAAGAASFVVAARAGHEIHHFIVPASAVQLGERRTTIGLRALHLAPVALNDVDARVAAGHGAGRLAQIGMAAVGVGIAQAALDHALGYAAEREQFGRLLREFEGIAAKLAGMHEQTAAARALLMAAAGAGSPRDAAAAKRFASAAAMRVTTDAVQIYGGYGYMRDYPVEKLMRDAKAAEVLGGLNETLAQTVSRGLYDG